MYHGNAITAATVGGAATLPFTGVSLLWAVLAGFALFAAGLALKRIAPKTEA